MIIVRAPFRISFAGGGSDLPEYYRQKKGAVISATINKYIYLTAHPYFEPEIINLKYSKHEQVRDAKAIQHKIFKELLTETSIKGIEITSIGDVPSGTGLGSSSSFTVALWHLLSAYQGKQVSKEILADKACQTEIERLKSPIGKQDQYAAAYGGLNLIEFNADESVAVHPVAMTGESKKTLNQNLFMVYTGQTRDANSILSTQKQETQNSSDTRDVISKMVEQAYMIKSALELGSFDDFGRMMNEAWQLKKKVATSISNPLLDQMYARGTKEGGALGGKLLGAGGGGFLLFYVPSNSQEKFKTVMKNYRSFDFEFENKGSELIFRSE